jgi:uncharacterized protein (DUF697 family)
VSVSKKTLPKVIRRTADGAYAAAGGLGATEQQGAPLRPTVTGSVDAESAALEGDIIEMATAPQPASPTGTLVGAARTGAGVDAARRLSHAHAIVQRHVAYAAVGGVIPLPIANVASITAVIVRMVKVLSDLYGVPFERDRARAIVIGMMGGAMPTGLAAVTTSTLVYIVPGSVLIGLAVSSIAAVACTRGIGRIFVEHYESGATLHDLSALESG